MAGHSRRQNETRDDENQGIPAMHDCLVCLQKASSMLLIVAALFVLEIQCLREMAECLTGAAYCCGAPCPRNTMLKRDGRMLDRD